jgi:hypothetical protein
MPPGTNADAHAHGDLHNPDVAHESSDISIKGVLWFVVILASTAFVVHVAMYGLFILFDRMEAANDPFVSPLATPAGTLPPEPRLQTTPWQDLKQFRTDEELVLHSYGWVDQKNGVVRVPIDKAKELLLQRGIPVRANAPTDPTEGTHVDATGESNSGRKIPAGQADMSTGDTGASGSRGSTASGGPEAGAPGTTGNVQTPPPTAQRQPKKPGGGGNQ